MAKDWWFKFEIPAWRNSPELRRCSLETKGFWIECIAIMRDLGVPQIKGSVEEIARSVGCFPDEAARCIEELKRTATADVTLRNGEVTLKSRKYAKELKAKEQTRLRVAKHRGNADVTPESQDRVISKELEVRNKRSSTQVESKKNGEEKSAAAPILSEDPEPASLLQAIGPDLLIDQTESVISAKLPIDTRRNLAAIIPPQLVPDWLRYAKGRLVGARSSSPRADPARLLGYWLTDFQRDFKNDYERLRKTESHLPSPADKLAEIEEHRRTDPIGPPPADLMSGLPAA